ncbi:hypothetical protein H2201_006565 [Coniosporium apollinis]|uniref:Nascent polypeptide-associated complex subunit alpha-like UBA domain-containing protein n=1 Tax=Coniosporium apollinis TaxID=61459 RepID=A0ABQ9NLY9_9PEZI|nr:hypothetical protein H2201_006565 [Coniosporium apollinis]
MAEEPQPPTIHEGASDPAPPEKTSAEDRKAAAALSSLDARGEDDDAPAGKKEVDTEALGKAMRGLDVKEDGGKKEEVKRKVVKVDQGDVALLVGLKTHRWRGWKEGKGMGKENGLTGCGQVEQLELSKAKATELLKAHEGDAVKAMCAFVTASA